MPVKTHPVIRARVKALSLPRNVLRRGLHECPYGHGHYPNMSYGTSRLHNLGIPFKIVSLRQPHISITNAYKVLPWYN